MITRSLFSGIPSITANCVRSRCGICVDDQSVESARRGSMGQDAARLHRDRRQTLMIQSLRDDAIGLFERRFDVSAPRAVNVNATFVPNSS